MKSIMKAGKLPDFNPKEGHLEMKTNGLFGGWDCHFVRLDNRELSYFKETEGGQHQRQGTLAFNLYQVEVELDMMEPGFWLRVRNSDHEFHFRAPNVDDQR